MCNTKRRHLACTILLLPEELMSGWRPKNYKLDELPNISFDEPREPIPLGTIFKMV